MHLEDIIHHDLVIRLETLKTDSELVKQIQTQLSHFGMYPDGEWLDGDYGSFTDKAITQFCDKFSLNNRQIAIFEVNFANKLLKIDTKSPFPTTENREKIYQKFLQAAAKGQEDYPVLLYKGIKTSPYQKEISDYPRRLLQKPDGKKVVCAIKGDKTFQSYPSVGKIPEIDEGGLEFLHADITEACICIGTFVERQLQVKWLGRNALSNDEFWSGTKIIPLTYVVSQANRQSAETDIDTCNIRGVDSQGGYRNLSFSDLARDVISYEYNLASSNSLGAMFKRFAPQKDIEAWLKGITGNQNLIFRGRYGEKPFINQPELYDRTTGKVLLKPDSQSPQWESNTISAYDLNRIISMVGWHYYLPYASRIPGAQWHSLESIIRAMGNDPARLTDLALGELGLENAVESSVIISKLGNGATSIRKRTEAVYVALVQFVDNSPQKLGEASRLVTLSMALRGAKQHQPRNFQREVVELDARMAGEVTEIIRRAVTGKILDSSF